MNPLRMVLAAVATAVFLAALPTVAAAGSANWHVYNLAASGQSLTSPVAQGQGSDLATFDFLSTPTTSYLLTTQGSQKGSTLGDIRNETVTATFSIEKSAGATFFYDTTNNPCGTPPSVRLFFQTSNAGGFDETHYWWSNPVAMQLDAVSGTATIANPVSGALWSDFFGHFGTGAYADGFDAAASNATAIGLSYGGGCFFANGVGIQNGAATFHLTGFSVS